EGQVLLELYATQNNLSPFLQDLGKWVVYSQLYQSLEVDSSVLFHQITSIEYHWHQQELPHQQICKTKAFQKLNPAQLELQEEVADAVQDLAEIVGALARLISEVQEDVKNCKTVWNRVFVSTVQLDVFTVVYKKLDTLLMREMRETFCLIEGQMEQ
ncbi:hypothetical protein CRUP_021888, partial [Coryphaenoides rupestris]